MDSFSGKVDVKRRFPVSDVDGGRLIDLRDARQYTDTGSVCLFAARRDDILVRKRMRFNGTS